MLPFIRPIAPMLLGVSAGLVVFVPLFGTIFGLPASFLAVAFLPVLIAALVLSDLEWPPLMTWLPVLAAAVVLTVCVLQASGDQLNFLFDIRQWSSRGDQYTESKLLMAAIFIIPQAIAALAILLCSRKNLVVNGVLAAIAFLASAAALRVLIQQGSVLLGTNLSISTKAMLETPGYSLVSYGTLFIVGAGAALRFRHGWILAGGLLFMAALMSRRADTIYLIAALCCLAVLGGFIGVNWMRYLASILIAAILFLLLHNSHNIQYFSGLAKAVNLRIEMLEESVAAIRAEPDEYTGFESDDSPAQAIGAEPVVRSPELPQGPGAVPSGEAPRAEAAVPASDPSQGSTVKASEDVSRSERSVPQAQLALGDAPASLTEATSANLNWLGVGLGKYQEATGSRFYYPHNLFLEIAIELGIVPAIAVMASVLVPIFLVLVSLFRGRATETILLCAACLTMLVALAVKAGEITFLGRVIFLATLVFVALETKRPRALAATGAVSQAT